MSDPFIIGLIVLWVISVILLYIYVSVYRPGMAYPDDPIDPISKVKELVIVPACGGCKYYVPWKDTKSGNCHRCPPQITEDSCYFPNVKDDEWCGDFEVKS